MKVSALLRRTESGLVIITGLDRIKYALSMSNTIIVDAPGIGDVVLYRDVSGSVSAILDESEIAINFTMPAYYG